MYLQFLKKVRENSNQEKTNIGALKCAIQSSFFVQMQYSTTHLSDGPETLILLFFFHGGPIFFKQKKSPNFDYLYNQDQSRYITLRIPFAQSSRTAAVDSRFFHRIQKTSGTQKILEKRRRRELNPGLMGEGRMTNPFTTATSC